MSKVGERAPDFDLVTTLGPGAAKSRVSLGDYDQRWLVVVFYPRDFSLVCPTELTALSSRVGEFDARHCSLLGVSTDTIETHDRWIATPRAQGGLGTLAFPIASDIDGVVATAYGVYHPRQGICLRALFIIDPNGVLQYQTVHSMSVGRSADDVLRVVAALDSGGMCPGDWRPDMPALDPAAVLQPGNMFASYEIESKVGAGSFGTVFRAHDTTLDRLVALKVFKTAAAESWDTVLREARAAAALQHQNVCTVYSVDWPEGAPVIAMEFIEGNTLREVMDHGPLPAGRVYRLAQQMAQGLAAAHAARVTHGDLKPANVMVTDQDSVKITDFGLARRAPGPELPATSGSPEPAPGATPNAGTTVVLPPNPPIAGTPAYMAPEMIRGVASSCASDTFAYGVILREMLTGERLFRASDLREVFRQINDVDPEQAAAGLPPEFAGIVRGALAHEPDARPQMASIDAYLTARMPSA